MARSPTMASSILEHMSLIFILNLTHSGLIQDDPMQGSLLNATSSDGDALDF